MTVRTAPSRESEKTTMAPKTTPALPLARATASDCGDGRCGCGCGVPVGRSDMRSAVPAPPKPLTIGELARRSGFSIKALRFYERRGVLPAAGRSPGRYRLYAEADLHRLGFVRQVKALGLALDEIRELVVAAREESCAMMRPRLLGVLDTRIRQTAQQIETLTRLKETLERRRRVLRRRPPSDHARGYCSCFDGHGAVIPVARLGRPTRRDAGRTRAGG